MKSTNMKSSRNSYKNDILPYFLIFPQKTNIFECMSCINGMGNLEAPNS